MHVVLFEPEIPPNTGNVARLCAATRTELHLIEPFGFKLDDAQLKRAGMDYWQQVAWHRWPNWSSFLHSLSGGKAPGFFPELPATNPSPLIPPPAGGGREKQSGTDTSPLVLSGGREDQAGNCPPGYRLWFIESGGPTVYSEAQFSPGDYLVFGRETAGLPRPLLEQNRERWLRIPMFNPEARSLNLSNCVALVLFEALRQQGFAGSLA